MEFSKISFQFRGNVVYDNNNINIVTTICDQYFLYNKLKKCSWEPQVLTNILFWELVWMKRKRNISHPLFDDKKLSYNFEEDFENKPFRNISSLFCLQTISERAEIAKNQIIETKWAVSKNENNIIWSIWKLHFFKYYSFIFKSFYRKET